MAIDQIAIQGFFCVRAKPRFFIGLRHAVGQRGDALHEDLPRLLSGQVAADERRSAGAYLFVEFFVRGPVPAGRIETRRHQIGTRIGDSSALRLMAAPCRRQPALLRPNGPSPPARPARP